MALQMGRSEDSPGQVADQAAAVALDSLAIGSLAQPVCSGIAATLAWQGYAHMTGEMIANSFPQLAWLLPQPAVRLQSPDVVAPTAPAIPSSSSEHLKVISLALAVVRQGMDQLAADQQQMATEIAKVREAQQEIRDKIISAPPRQRPPAPARRSVPQKTLAH